MLDTRKFIYLLVLSLAAYYSLGQFNNIRKRASEIKIVQINLSGAEFNYPKFNLRKGDKVTLIVRKKPRAEFEFIELDREGLFKFKSKSIVARDGYIVGGDKLARNSKVRLMIEGQLVKTIVEDIEIMEAVD